MRRKVRETFPEPVAEINVTPMIDVMLVLLIIFMVVIPALASMLNLAPSLAAIPEKADRVTLTLELSVRYLLENAGRTAKSLPPLWSMSFGMLTSSSLRATTCCT